MSVALVDVYTQERGKRESAIRSSVSEGVRVSLPISHLRALYADIIVRCGGPASAEATDFRERLREDADFPRQAQIVGELYRMGVLQEQASAPQPCSIQAGIGLNVLDGS